MKIFLLASSFPSYEDPMRGIFNYRLVKQMVALKEEVFIIFFRMWLPGRKIITTYSYEGINVNQVCLPLIPFNNYYSLRANNYLCRIFGWKLFKKELEKSDIIHSVYLTANGIIASYWAERLDKIHVSQAIGSDVNSDLKKLINKKHKKAGISQILKRIDGILSNSKDIETSIKSFCPASLKLKTLYRGIEIGSPPKFKDPNEIKIHFLYLGGLDSNKRMEYGINTKGGVTLMHAWKKVEDELMLLNGFLKFGGSNSRNNYFYTWYKSLKYPERVENIGKLTPAKVKEEIEKSDVIIIPSMEEGMPNLLMECNVLGRPVIGSDAGGIPEAIENKKTGYIFEKGDFTALSELLVKCSKCRSHNVEMGQNAYKRVKTDFDAKNYSLNILEFYKEVKKCVE